MRWVLLVFTIVWGQTARSQASELEEQNGLGIFKFGTHTSVFGKQIRSDVIISYGQEYFIYEGPDADTIYGLKVSKTTLGFFRDSLNYIDFYLNKLDDASFDVLKELMYGDYGDAERMEDPDENGLLEAYRWIGGDIWLQLKRYGTEASDWGDRNMTVISCRLTDY